MDEPTATMRTIDGKPVLRFERRFAHSRAKVWKAITDPAEMAHWFPAAIETELKPGARMRFTFPDEAPINDISDGEVLEFDPPKVYAFRWNKDVLRLELVPDGPGCRLVFTQTLGGTWASRLSAGRNAAGWDVCLGALAARLDEQTFEPPTEWLDPMERYVEKFSLAEGEVHATDDGFVVRFARDLVWKSVDEVWSLLTAAGVGPRQGAGDNTDNSVEVGKEPPVRATNGYLPAGPVTAVEAPRVLEYEWLHDGEPAGRVRWEIIHDQLLGTRVELTQTIPARLADLRVTALAAWQTQLELFFAATHGVIRCPWPEERTEELKALYAKRITLGTLVSTEDGRFALRFERVFAHPPEKVWRALTETDHLSTWFPAVVEFDLTPGAKLRFGPTAEQKRRYGMAEDQAGYGEITAVDPPNLLEYTWGEEILRWELTSDTAGRCRLVFTNIFDDRDSAAPAAAGWHAGLEVVEAQLDGREIDWSAWDRADELGPEYASSLA